MRSLVSSVLAAALALSMAGCSGPASQDADTQAAAEAGRTVTHAQGTTTVQGVPSTVIVTDWAAFDNLTALGVKVAGVPNTFVPGHLEDKVTPDMIKVGSLQEPDIEAIAAATPDLVVIGARSRKAYPTLSKIAPTIDTTLDNTDVIGGLKANLTLYGDLFDRQDRAKELIAQLDEKVANARAAAEGKGSGLVIVTNGGRLGIYGPQSRVSWMYSSLGIPSVFDEVDDREHGGDAITFEYLVKTNPDWLFVIDRDAGVGKAGAAKALLDNQLLHQAGFWKNDRVVYLDPQAAYVTMHGFDAVTLLLDQVATAYNTH
ncbi:siderophore ABC transporter substrate-binding protein [Stenotrophomonas mori]|uniref:Siderophore ABC transporter substrate-binding protein n=1 Tax=Stenotrophomonas mori TaxID=2871096 RepID=A0ABT0SJS2_9GAMM|nr:siderophore ABC transporter substrate-binding protein [Stenotrophomonas mori]MCL7715333.1 siderophore ABC transporter substrate-binding protein [Stenotrophomonas mori]